MSVITHFAKDHEERWVSSLSREKQHHVEELSCNIDENAKYLSLIIYGWLRGRLVCKLHLVPESSPCKWR